MKSLFRTRTYVGLAALGVLAFLGFQAFAQQNRPTPTVPPLPTASKAKFVLILNGIHATKKDQAGWENVLHNLKTQLYDVYTFDENGNCKHHTPGKDENCPTTGAITTPGSTEDGATAKVTFISTRTTIQIPSMFSSDITTVVGEIQ
jgi:hypothetical protein